MQDIDVEYSKINQMLAFINNQLLDLAGSRIEKIKNIYSLIILSYAINLFKKSSNNDMIEVLISNVENKIFSCGHKLL